VPHFWLNLPEVGILPPRHERRELRREYRDVNRDRRHLDYGR